MPPRVLATVMLFMETLPEPDTDSLLRAVMPAALLVPMVFFWSGQLGYSFGAER